MGANVDDVTAYQTVPDGQSAALLLEKLRRGELDLITFTSSSTATHFAELLPREEFAQLVNGVKIACIGPITSQTARKLGLPVHIEAASYTIEGLCEAIIEHYTGAAWA